MNNLYEAYEDYLRHIGQIVFPEDFRTYLLLKRICHGPEPQPVFSGVVPWMIRWMTHGSYKPTFQHTLTQDHYLHACKNDFQTTIVINSEEEFSDCVDQITLVPAIYLCEPQERAVYETVVPIGAVMAIQLLG